MCLNAIPITPGVYTAPVPHAGEGALFSNSAAVWYSFTLDQPQFVSFFSVQGIPFLDVNIYSDCINDPSTLIATGSSSCNGRKGVYLFDLNIPAGTYFLEWINPTNKPNSDNYGSFDFVYRPNTCGNATLDQWESCDDGNTSPGDGCDCNCLIEQE